MKKQALAVAVALLLSAIASGVCYAQQPTLAAHIPFAFQVGDKTLPAGEYRIEFVPTPDGYFQEIRRTDGEAWTTASMTIALDSKDGKSEPQLIFNHYGNSYFLSQIWTGAGQGRELFKSKREKETARGQVRTEVALLAYPSSARP